MTSGSQWDLDDDWRGLIYKLVSESPNQTARHIANALRRHGHDVDKSRVNAVLYRYSTVFHNDGAVPPRWSLASNTTQDSMRAVHRIASVLAFNFKAFELAQPAFAPITLLFGENSSGKSSVFHVIQLLKQSWETGTLRFEGPSASFGSYGNAVHSHNLDRPIVVGVGWGGADSGWSRFVMLNAFNGHSSKSTDDTHPVDRIQCVTAGRHIALDATPNTGDLSARWWYVYPLEKGERASTSRITFPSDYYGFPKLSRPQPAPSSHALSVPDHVLATEIRKTFEEATDAFKSIQHIGPTRAVPLREATEWEADQRDSTPDYLLRLSSNSDLVVDVNEWLLKFEIPYAIEVEHSGRPTDPDVRLRVRRIGAGSERVHLRDVGFGVSQLLPIIVILLGSREKTILIEEPEAHVHPRLQSVLGDLFVTSEQDYGNVLLVETHSEPILLRLQRRIAEQRIGPDEVAVHHVTRQGEASQIETVAIRDNGQLDYQWPGGFFDNRMEDLVAILNPEPEQ
ncbi:AAA family ATPase [Smaragdicoccus niigatensis]|uniref:AAA family ATPase n=1 Tax=Smaragdicoccus niigatensis TaxID=359359 RepID=UPI0003A9CBC9|nr:DUF3696 domain-containing protein [Smaragdicoccus niigatensis]